MKAFETPEWDLNVSAKKKSQKIEILFNKKRNKENVVKGRVEKVKKNPNESKFIELQKKIESILEKKKLNILTKTNSKQSHTFSQLREQSGGIKKKTNKLKKTKLKNMHKGNDEQKHSQKSTQTLHNKKIKNKLTPKLKKAALPQAKSVSDTNSQNKSYSKIKRPARKSSENFSDTTRKVKNQTKLNTVSKVKSKRTNKITTNLNNMRNGNDEETHSQKSTQPFLNKKIKNKHTSKLKKAAIPQAKPVLSETNSKNKAYSKIKRPSVKTDTTRKVKNEVTLHKVPNPVPKLKSRKKPLTHQTLFFRKAKRNRINNDTTPENAIKHSNLMTTAQVYREPSGRARKLQQQPLRERMLQKLTGARFRYLNEQMYTSTGKDTKQYFDTDSDAFQAYHDGYRQQVARWPLNPVDIIINKIKKLPQNHVIADFGCGDAKLAMSVPHTVHSFDLVATHERVTACDMAHVPLKDDSVDVVVFCLSLMGTNLKDYLMEARRVLRNNGLLKIAEVESRFENMDSFISNLHSYGFINSAKDVSHSLFCFLDFVKRKTKHTGNQNLPNVTLKPCLYKKR